MLVVAGEMRLHRALVVRYGSREVALDVGENPEVLLDARQQLARLAAELERTAQALPGLVHRARAQRQTTHRVERFGGQQVALGNGRDVVTAITEVAGARGIVAKVIEDRQASQRFGKDGAFARSEEHTSELQSLRHLVCRLLLEK